MIGNRKQKSCDKQLKRINKYMKLIEHVTRTKNSV